MGNLLLVALTSSVVAALVAGGVTLANGHFERKARRAHARLDMAVRLAEAENQRSLELARLHLAQGRPASVTPIDYNTWHYFNVLRQVDATGDYDGREKIRAELEAKRERRRTPDAAWNHESA